MSSDLGHDITLARHDSTRARARSAARGAIRCADFSNQAVAAPCSAPVTTVVRVHGDGDGILGDGCLPVYACCDHGDRMLQRRRSHH